MVSVLKQDTHLETFKIKVSPSFSSIPKQAKPSFDRCIELAAATSRVLKHLNLHMWYAYVFPQPVFRVESLVHLDLKGGRLLQPAQSEIMWPNLKTLRLSIVDIGEGVFESIVRGCPLIEAMKICFCRFNISNFHIKVSNLGYLKKVDIWSTDTQTFEVDAAPNLESLACCYFSAVDFGKHEYHKLRSLSLTGPKALITDDFLTNMACQFPRLEELSIGRMHPDIKRISLSSTSLKKINLDYIQGLEEATFDVPNLVHFGYDSNVVPKLSFAGNSCRWVSRIRFNISNANIDTSWFLKLKEFLATLNMHVTSIWVYFERGVTNFSINAKPRTCADSISYTVGEFNLCTTGLDKQVFSISFASEILDSILLTCWPKRIRLVDCLDCEFPEIVYNNLITLKIFDDPKLMWSVTEIRMDGCWTELVEGSTKYRGFWYKVLKQPRVVDIDKFVELFRVDHHDWKPKFTIVFHLEYTSRPVKTKDDDAPCRPAATSVKQATILDDLKHSLDQPRVLQQQPVVEVCRTLNSVNEGRSVRSRKFTGCCCFHFPNCKPFRSVKRLLFH